MDKIYLGDGAYVTYDGWSYILTTEDGISVQNTVVLEPDAVGLLFKFVEKMNRLNKETRKP